MPDILRYERITNTGAVSFRNKRITLDRGTGSISSLIIDNKERVAEGRRCALVRYQSFSRADFDRFIAAYTDQAGPDAQANYGHFGFTGEDSESRIWDPAVIDMWQLKTDTALSIIAHLSFDSRAHLRYGAPGELFCEYGLLADTNDIAIKLVWLDKPPTMLPKRPG